MERRQLPADCAPWLRSLLDPKFYDPIALLYDEILKSHRHRLEELVSQAMMRWADEGDEEKLKRRVREIHDESMEFRRVISDLLNQEVRRLSSIERTNRARRITLGVGHWVFDLISRYSVRTGEIVRSILLCDAYESGKKMEIGHTLGRGPGVSAVVNQIQALIDTAISSARIAPDDVRLGSHTGDGAYLAFDWPEHAHQVMSRLHEEATRFSSRSGARNQHRYTFRVAIVTAPMFLHFHGKEALLEGIARKDLARLEKAAKPGNVLIDSATHEGLGPELQALYADSKPIRGKRHEKPILAHCLREAMIEAL